MAEVIHFQEPVIDPRRTPEQNLQVISRWAAELTQNLNLLQSRINKESNDEKS